MAEVGAKNPTLLDLATRLDPNGQVATVIEMLNETNEVLPDMTFLECNDGSGHKTTVRTGLPTVAWRLLNYGVPNSKSGTAQIRDGTGMLEAYAEVDKALADMSGNAKAFRTSEDSAFLESMNQEFLSTLFYGNTAVNPERFLGLSPRYSDSTAPNGKNIINGGGTGSDNTSIWLIGWSPNTIHGIYPKGSDGGITHRDLGEQTLKDAQGGQYQGYRTHFKMHPGLAVRDWRFGLRIANIDISDLKKDAATGADLVDLMTQALEARPVNHGIARWAFYANPTITSYLRRQIRNSKNVNLSLEEVAGKKVVHFDGVPVRRVDALLKTEAAVTF